MEIFRAPRRPTLQISLTRTALSMVLWLALTCLGLKPALAAKSVVLEWNPSPSASAIGYLLFYGTNSGQYYDAMDVSSGTAAFVPGLVGGLTYYFAVTAYNEDLVESDPSDELVYEVPDEFGLRVASVPSATSVVVAWNARPDPATIGYVLYSGGSPGEYLDAIDAATSTNAFVPDLVEGSTYYFAVAAYDEDLVETELSDELVYRVPQAHRPPFLDPLPDLTLNEDAGVQTILLTGLNTGGTSTNLLITAASSKPGLIPQPIITYSLANGTGQLRFAAMSNGNGSATITIAMDNRQPSNNFLARSFTVSVLPVNDQPTVSPLNDLTLQTNVGLQVISLAGISSGASNENQTLTLSASSSNPALIPTLVIQYASPSATGTLRFTPATNASGSAIISVTVSDGQAANATVTRTFNVDVAAPPAAPVTYFLEAEAGALVSPMIVAASTNASNGRYVYSQSTEVGSVTFRVTNTVAGNFILWCRVLSPNSAQDSFYVAVDGGTETVYRTAQNIWSTAWQWTRINDESQVDALVFPLSAGTHTFRFRSRESSTLLDSLYITNDRNFVPVKVTVARKSTPQPAMEVSFQSAAGYRYAVQSSTNLSSWTTLWSIPTNIALAQVLSYSDPALNSSTRRFYRVRVNP